MQIARDAKLDDGLFDVVMTGQGPKRRFPRFISKAFDGSYVDDPSIHVERAREVRITADRPFTMYADGDPIGELPVRVRAVSGAVNIIVPLDSHKSNAFAAPHPAAALPAGSPAATPDAGTPSDESPVSP